MNLVTFLTLIFLCTVFSTIFGLLGFRFGDGWGVAASLLGCFLPFIAMGIAALRHR